MKILIAGDFCPRFRTAELIEEDRYDQILGAVKSTIEDVDYSIVNFECSVVDSQRVLPIKKNGPRLKCIRKAVDVISRAGFDCVTLANNHILDFGIDGLKNTVDAIKTANLDFVGVGSNSKEASRILYKEIDGNEVAFINCCEHEFSVAEKDSPGSNGLNPIHQYYSIKEACSNASYVIVIVHGGHEYYQLPSPRMKEIYHFFIDCGADAVVNHHQHCYSGYEIYKGKPVFYGLGNFCFDSDSVRKGIWTTGYMVELTLKDNVTFNIHPYIQCADEPIVKPMPGDMKRQFDEDIFRLNSIILDDNRLEAEHVSWMNKTSKMYEMALSPLANRILCALAYRGWIPSFLPEKKILKIMNYIDCESHRDRMIHMLKNMINN